MTVGYAVDKPSLDFQAGQLARQIDQWATAVLKVQAYLAATPDATLEGAAFGYTTGEVALLKSAFTDLSLLAQIYQGSATLAQARNLGEFSLQLAGLFT